jgi:signal transduction histidine kinase
MISDLCDVSRLNARRMTVNCKEVDLPAAARRVIDHHPDFASPCHVLVDHDSELRAWADPERVEQVLTNLLTNAAKFSEPGTLIAIAITCEDGAARVTVEDHGSGIPLEYQERIFSRFDRSSKARVSGTTGLGVGLHIAKGLIEAQVDDSGSKARRQRGHASTSRCRSRAW